MSETAPQDILQRCTIEGNTVKLPPEQLDRKMYEQVKKSLELIGGKWKSGKVQGFVFPTDPTDLLAQVAGGEKRNIKKEYQFFATPAGLADRLVEMADIKPGHLILEPSAGQGAIIEAVRRSFSDNADIHYYELMDTNNMILEQKRIWGAKQIGKDFLQGNADILYDRIVANPPFTKNQDIDHIRRMYELLKPGGILVTLSSPSWSFGSQKKQVAFKDWLDEIGAEIEEVQPGTFKDSGTMTASILIKIIKNK